MRSHRAQRCLTFYRSVETSGEALEPAAPPGGDGKECDAHVVGGAGGKVNQRVSTAVSETI